MPTTNDTDKAESLITPRELAAVLNQRYRTIFFWVESGRIPYYKVGRSIRFRASEIEQFLDSCRVPAGCRVPAKKVEHEGEEKEAA